VDRPCEGGFDPPPTKIHAGILRNGIDLGIIPELIEIFLVWRDIPRDRPERHEDRMTIQTAATFEPVMIAAHPQAGIRSPANPASVHDSVDIGETRHPGERNGHSGRGAHGGVSRRPDGRLLV